MPALLVFLFLLCLPLFADSKTEAALAARLAATEAARTEVVRQNAVLAASLAKLSTAGAATGTAAAVTAASAQATAETNASIAQQAAIAAATAAADAKAQALSYQSAVERGNNALLITTVAGFLTLFAVAGIDWGKKARDRRWARDDKEAEDKKTEKHRAETERQLDTIHTLVNSNLTASMDRELAALTANVVLLEKVFDMAPTVEAPALIKTAHDKIAELELELHGRQSGSAADRLKT